MAEGNRRGAEYAKIVLRIVGLFVASVVVLIGLTDLVLQTRWGGERIRRAVVAGVNRQILGRLDIGRLSFGGNRVVLWDVTLRDPEGERVAQVARAEVDVSIVRLLRQEVRVTAVAIEAPRLDLLSDSRGLNLSRATAPRKKPAPPAPPRPRTTEEGWVVGLDSLRLTHGDVSLAAVGRAGARETKVAFAELDSSLRARYATGNGSLDLTFRLGGQSLLAPAGPIRLSIDAGVHGDAVRFAVNGQILGGTLQARGNVDRQHFEGADVLVAVAIPQLTLAGHDWGPLRIDGAARPGSIPKLEALLAIPGIELTAKGGGDGRFGFDGKLAVADLALTAKAARALTGSDLPPITGHGRIDLAAGGPVAGAPASWNGRLAGLFERLSFADTVIGGLSIEGRTAKLASEPGQADLRVAIASVNAGATRLRGITLDAELREKDISAEVKLAAPERVSLTLAGRLDDGRQGLVLGHLALAYPGGRWATEGKARLRFGGDTWSLANFRLLSQGQALAIDGAKTGEQIDAHVALDDLRLDLLPAFVVDPALHLAGSLDADVKARGELANPRVVARLRLQHGRYEGFSRIGARMAATLADRRVIGTLEVYAPFAAVDARFKLPIDPLAPGAPLDVRLGVARLDLGDTLRAAAAPVWGDGKVTASLRLTGSAGSPKVELTVDGRDLEVNRPGATPAAGKGPVAIDVGHARVRLTYADHAARADVDFTSSQGGTLRVDAGARVDLSYPHVTRRLVVAKLPVHGKVAAHDFDVAWIARFNPRLETLGGQVDADARVVGTVGDPQFVGDVHWKNGRLVANAPPAPSARPSAR